MKFSWQLIDKLKGKCDLLFSCRSIALLLISNYLFIVSYPSQGQIEVSQETFLFDIKETRTVPSYAPVAVVVSINNSQQKEVYEFLFLLIITQLGWKKRVSEFPTYSLEMTRKPHPPLLWYPHPTPGEISRKKKKQVSAETLLLESIWWYYSYSVSTRIITRSLQV